MSATLSTPARPADIRRRIETLRVTIAEAERKKAGITHAIQCRRVTLQRLEAQLAMSGEDGPASARHDRF